MTAPLLVSFAAGDCGVWRVERITPVMGESLPIATSLTVYEGNGPEGISDHCWVLRGSTGHTRYTNRAEVRALTGIQQGLARPQATRAALIPIRKSDAWWALAQDERRAIFEEQSKHIAIGMEYLPPVARRLHHSRELGEPFDFLTWFEYAPEHENAFEDMLKRLRQTAEWTFVDREVDVRLSRT